MLPESARLTLVSVKVRIRRAGHGNIIGSPLIGKRCSANDTDTKSHIDARRNSLARGLAGDDGRDDIGDY